jgi:hypothetical protein
MTPGSDDPIRRRGSGRSERVVGVTLPPKDWPKHKLKFDFKGEVFRWNEDADPVEEFNLQSHYQEPGVGLYSSLIAWKPLVSTREPIK